MRKRTIHLSPLVRTFAPYFALLKPVKGPFVGALVCGLIYGAASGLGFPLMAYKILPKIFGEGTPDKWMLIGAVALMPVAFLLRGLAGFGSNYLSSYCGIRVLIQLQTKVYAKLQSLPLSFFGKTHVGDLMARVLGDTGGVQGVVTGVSNDLIKQPIQFLSAIGALVYLAAQKKEFVFVLFALAIVPLCILPIRLAGRKILARALHVQNNAGNLSSALNENLSAAREVRAFNLQSRETTRFHSLIEIIARHSMKVVKYTSLLAPTLEWFATIGISVAIFYAAQAQLRLEDMLPLLTALYMTYDPIKKFGAIHNAIKRGEASVERIEFILHADDSIRDPEDPVPFDLSRTDIEMSGAVFSYTPGTPVLRQIDVSIPAGSVTALVGPSGAGKSTFVNLLPRFYDLDSGAVRIGGRELREYSKNDLRAHISIVSQDTMLFNDTILNNIRLGRLDATDQEVEAAARHAFAHDFITEFDDGYETLAGERGARLSGGQKQRIAIARAFLKNAPILIMDEATSSLDSESEEKIQLALSKLVQGRTVILIAHRFSTIRMADQIIVMENGVVRASGSHAELYTDDDLYRNLYDKQFIE
ncbi:MAG: ABC transporter ATP-binding protein [Verrucomicrobia bacterium]|nr:ABC transporter ATP-binding protein [Verrucomicrobiota bacterium]